MRGRCWHRLVLEQGAVSGASVAKVAMSHALNANIVHRQRALARERVGPGVLAPRRVALPPNASTSTPQFVPVSLSATPLPAVPVDIRIELHCGATLDEPHLADHGGSRLRGSDVRAVAVIRR